jgi:hypothetical protein
MATDEAQGQARASFASLPRALQHAIWRRVPVDARARAKLVSTGWCDELADVSLWTRLDLSLASGVRVRVTDAVLRGASGLARGGLTALDVSLCEHVTRDALLAVATSNARALTELRVEKDEFAGRLQLLSYANAEALLLAAPLLRVLETDVEVTATEALRMLHHEAPFAPLRVRHLDVSFELADILEPGIVAEVAAAIVAHASLSLVCLRVAGFRAPGALDAVVDAALIRRLSSFTFWFCSLSPASVPALVRLLGGSALRELCIVDADDQLLDVPAAALLGHALRANSTITKLSLEGIALWANPAAVVALLLGALMGHVSLRHLTLGIQTAPTEQAVALIGPALGALVAANTPALKHLVLHYGHLGDAGMRPLLEALPSNTHLESLQCVGNGMTALFARDVLLPAVRANTSLRMLEGDELEAAVEAKALIAARNAALRNAR